MGLLQCREPRQHHVGVAGGLVQVVVDADHRLEPAERRVEARRLWSAQRRVAGHGHQRPQLPLTRRVHLLGQARQRVLAQHLGDAPHPTAGPVDEALLEVGRGDGGHRLHQRGGEHHAAGPVEVAGEHVHHVEQPRRQGAELLRARADAPVDRGARRGRHLPGHAADGVGGDATGRRHPLGGEGGGQGPDLVHAVDDVGQRPEVRQVLGEQGLDHGRQQRGVGARPDGHPLVGPVRGAGATGIDHDHLAAPRTDGVDLAQHVGAGQQAALRGLGVAAQQQPVLGAMQVRCGDAPHVPVQQQRHDVARPLVHRPG